MSRRKASYDIFETPFGWVGVVASAMGLRRTTLPHPLPEDCLLELGPSLEEATASPEGIAGLQERMGRYFRGEHMTFDGEPIDIGDASPFLQAAWDACRSIPYGETRSYQWLAGQAGRPLAARAAGQAMARNRLPLVIPCHRVIAADGSLRGFGRGSTHLALKQRLLDLESSSA